MFRFADGNRPFNQVNEAKERRSVFDGKSRSFLSLDEADFENPAINLQDALCFFFCSRGGEFMLLFIPIPIEFEVVEILIVEYLGGVVPSGEFLLRRKFC